jgi:hypothetical protein
VTASRWQRKKGKTRRQKDQRAAIQRTVSVSLKITEKKRALALRDFRGVGLSKRRAAEGPRRCARSRRRIASRQLDDFELGSAFRARNRRPAQIKKRSRATQAFPFDAGSVGGGHDVILVLKIERKAQKDKPRTQRPGLLFDS